MEHRAVHPDPSSGGGDSGGGAPGRMCGQAHHGQQAVEEEEQAQVPCADVSVVIIVFRRVKIG